MLLVRAGEAPPKASRLAAVHGVCFQGADSREAARMLSERCVRACVRVCTYMCVRVCTCVCVCVRPHVRVLAAVHGVCFQGAAACSARGACVPAACLPWWTYVHDAFRKAICVLQIAAVWVYLRPYHPPSNPLSTGGHRCTWSGLRPWWRTRRHREGRPRPSTWLAVVCVCDCVVRVVVLGRAARGHSSLRKVSQQPRRRRRKQSPPLGSKLLLTTAAAGLSAFLCHNPPASPT
jgi:hypothetical protein